jgi:hypothetical protein
VNSKILLLTLASAIASAGGTAFAQQASDATRTPATSSPTEPSPTEPSPTAASSSDSADAEAAATAALIAKANAAAAAAAAKSPTKITDEATLAKMAKKAGWHTEVQNGTTFYCRETVDVGTRFSSKKCGTLTQVAVVLEQQQYEKDQLKQRGCGGNCGGK